MNIFHKVKKRENQLELVRAATEWQMQGTHHLGVVVEPA